MFEHAAGEAAVLGLVEKGPEAIYNAAVLVGPNGLIGHYRDGSDAKTVWIRLHWDDAARRLTLEPDKRMKQWPGGVRAFTVEVAGGGTKPRRVEFQGKPVVVEL